jgi:hypothetical protein
MKSQSAIYNCRHCENMGMNITDHHVSKCPVLAGSTCFSCKKKGHTAGYCPDKKMKLEKNLKAADVEVGEQNAPVANVWAQIAKKAMTDKDRVQQQVAEAKVKADIAEKKKKEHEAYLERKAKREARAQEQKERAKKQEEYDDKRYELFRTHMFHAYGYDWMQRFHPYSDDNIPERLFDRLQKEIKEEEEAEWREEQESNRRETEQREAFHAQESEMRATLSKTDYEKWEDDYWSINMEEIDDWLDYTADDYSNGLRREEFRERNGKIWIEEKMREGKIQEIGKDQYEYYP